MFRQHYLKFPQTKLAVNPIVKAYIFSEALLWSGWNLVIPIAALFIADSVKGGNIQIAATGYSIYLTVRVIFELISGKYLAKASEKRKLFAASAGALLVSTSLFLFAFSSTVLDVLISYAVSGFALGISAPAKNALFSIHLDKDSETTEWGIADGVTYICMALATALGGFIAADFGFKLLFMVAGAVSLLGFIPYALNILDEK